MKLAKIDFEKLQGGQYITAYGAIGKILIKGYNSPDRGSIYTNKNWVIVTWSTGTVSRWVWDESFTVLEPCKY